MRRTNERTIEEANKLINMCFQGNLYVDNIAYALNVSPFNMPKLYEFVHHELAHALSGKYADGLAEFLMQINMRIVRDSLDRGKYEFSSVSEMMSELEDIFYELNIQIDRVIETAMEYNDKPVEDFMRNFQVEVGTLYWKQCKILAESSRKYDAEGLMPLFNEGFKSSIII